jgi:hypothetical protein
MEYQVKIVERMKAVVTVKARSVTEAFAKAERKYCKDIVECNDLEGVCFSITVDEKELLSVEKK